MKTIFWVLCLSLYPAIAAATNFDVCVNEAKANHNDTTVDNYTSYKCEGSTAEKLAARPDECPGGQKPSDRSLSRKTKPLPDGLYSSLRWRAGKCEGMCESVSSNSKDTTYTCTLKIFSDGSGTAENAPPDNSREAGPPAPRQVSNDGGGRRRRSLAARSPAWSPRLHRYGGGYNGGSYNGGDYDGDRYGGRYRFGGGYRRSLSGLYSNGGYGPPPPRPSSWVPEPPGGWGPSPSGCDCY